MNKIIIGISAILFTGIFLVFFGVQGEKVLSVSSELQQEKITNINKKDNNIPNKKTVNIIFGGDVMFDRYIRQISNTKGYNYVLDDLENIFKDIDCVVANLEGPITNNNSVSIGSEFGSPNNYRFTFAPDSARALNKNNFCVVNLGNNHIGNFGDDGIVQTKKYLKENNIAYFGDINKEGEVRYFIKDFDGIKIAFVNYNQFVSNAHKHSLIDIKSVKDKADFVVVYTHWGEEYKTKSQKQQQNIAHQFIDAGADIIIGSHPHVVQEKEMYKNKAIYYSLGNFVFDQYFSNDTKKGKLVNAIFDKDSKKIIIKEQVIKLTPSGQTTL